MNDNPIDLSTGLLSNLLEKILLSRGSSLKAVSVWHSIPTTLHTNPIWLLFWFSALLVGIVYLLRNGLSNWIASATVIRHESSTPSALKLKQLNRRSIVLERSLEQLLKILPSECMVHNSDLFLYKQRIFLRVWVSRTEAGRHTGTIPWGWNILC